MRHRRALLALLATLPLSAAPVANAEDPAGPPFTYAEAWDNCNTGTDLVVITVSSGGTCSSSSDATKSGIMSTEVSLASGALPISSADGWADAYVGEYLWVESASIISYTVTYRVTGAHADATPDASLPSSYGHASTHLYADAYALGTEASGGFYRQLAAAGSQPVADGTYTGRMILATEDGLTMTGPVQVSFGLSSGAYLEDAPSASAASGATVEILDIATQILE